MFMIKKDKKDPRRLNKGYNIGKDVDEIASTRPVMQFKDLTPDGATIILEGREFELTHKEMAMMYTMLYTVYYGDVIPDAGSTDEDL